MDWFLDSNRADVLFFAPGFSLSQVTPSDTSFSQSKDS